MPDYVDDMGPELKAAAALFKSLSHPSRLLICCQLLDGPMGVAELEEKLELKQPNLSRELAKLRAEGIATSTRIGGAVTYELADERVRWVLEAYRTQGSSNTNAVMPKGTLLNGAYGNENRANVSPFQGGGAMFARTFDEMEEA